MNSIKKRAPTLHFLLTVVASGALLLAAGCSNQPADPAADFDLAPFKEMAMSAGCADIVNRLYLVDGQMVFWSIEGNCSDASFARTLFGSTVDNVLCSLHDSIAGPMGDCQDAYRAMFDTMVANLDQPDLGLGSAHTVEPIPL
jgi:hypothetical protein